MILCWKYHEDRQLSLLDQLDQGVGALLDRPPARSLGSLTVFVSCYLKDTELAAMRITLEFLDSLRAAQDTSRIRKTQHWPCEKTRIEDCPPLLVNRT